jgi:hypothetical protein
MGMLETRNRVPAALADGASQQEVFNISKNYMEILPVEGSFR